MLRMEATIKRSLCLFTYGGAKKDMELVPGRVKPIIKESVELMEHTMEGKNPIRSQDGAMQAMLAEQEVGVAINTDMEFVKETAREAELENHVGLEQQVAKNAALANLPDNYYNMDQTRRTGYFQEGEDDMEEMDLEGWIRTVAMQEGENVEDETYDFDNFDDLEFETFFKDFRIHQK